MNKLDFWNLPLMVAVASATLIAVLGIWGLINGITALKIYFTMFLIGCAAAFVKNIVDGQVRERQMIESAGQRAGEVSARA